MQFSDETKLKNINCSKDTKKEKNIWGNSEPDELRLLFKKSSSRIRLKDKNQNALKDLHEWQLRT